MEPIYVTGHKNPDSDSIVSAIAYASLRNAMGDRAFVAVRIGEVSDETQRILERFEFDAPMRLKNLRTQVRDLSFDRPPIISGAVTVRRAWELMQQGGGSDFALPVTDEEGKLFGMLTAGDIAQYDMRYVDELRLDNVPLFNLLSCLDGQLWGEHGEVTTLNGRLIVALPKTDDAKVRFPAGSVIVTGNRPETILAAFDEEASCVIVCGGTLDPAVLEHCKDTCVITTPYDAYRACRLIVQAEPVSRICSTEGITSFRLDDYVDDVRDATLQSRFRGYPILDADGLVVGTLSRYHLLRPNRKKVVLVDHNEISQSIPGLEQAEILEIIDHHRLADVQTSAPVYMRNEPVGSTCTIITTMYQERGIMPSRRLAGLLAAGIVSDTIAFKSPTCTDRDVIAAERMARLADESLDELSRFIFTTHILDDVDLPQILFNDFKQFQIAGHIMGIGQVTSINATELKKHSRELLVLMERVRMERGYDMLLLMLTDVLREGSELLVAGDLETASQAFNVEITDGSVFLPGVVSRKKQIVPALSLLWG
ncbi:MAG: putative manganese-dependent inorganic diphosphatase [Clostridiales bacterium]|nr:putative manganese-dependent inorganic diphosphatase [Clostridiales bacterium]